MGITPSREDFKALEGYANQSDDTRIEILRKAGFEIEEQDHEIGKFLGTNEIFGAFIRGIISKCLEMKTEQINTAVNQYLENERLENKLKMERQTAEMNEILNTMAKEWERKEEYYFGTTDIKQHQITTEHAYVDPEDMERIKKNESHLPGWDDNSSSSVSSVFSTESDNLFDNNNRNIRHKEITLTSQGREDVTMGNTNKKSPMQEESKKGKNNIITNQSFTIALGNELNMDNTEEAQNKESMHRPKGIKDIKFYAGLMATSQKKNDQQIIDIINDSKILSYHINTLGKCMRNGNLYTYLGFYTEKERAVFCNNGKIRDLIGNTYNLKWLDALDKKIIINLRNIKKGMDEEEIYSKVEENFGKIIRFISKTETNDAITTKLEIQVTCSDEELMNNWGIIIGNQMINIEPINYKEREIRQRGDITATIMDIPEDIDLGKFIQLLHSTNAKTWYKVKERHNSKYKIVVLFNNKEDRRKAIANHKIEIEGIKLTWFFRDEDNFSNQNTQNNKYNRRPDTRYYQQKNNMSQHRYTRCKICNRNNHTTESCFHNKERKRYQKTNPRIYESRKYDNNPHNNRRRSENERRNNYNFPNGNERRYNSRQYQSDNDYRKIQQISYNERSNTRRINQQFDGKNSITYNQGRREQYDRRYTTNYRDSGHGNRSYGQLHNSGRRY
jgi:hypothetical protein